jgi:exonuclease I
VGTGSFYHSRFDALSLPAGPRLESESTGICRGRFYFSFWDPYEFKWSEAVSYVLELLASIPIEWPFHARGLHCFTFTHSI